MSVDDFAKILIVIAISISLLGISYQTMRLIGAFADSIKDLRKVLQVFGDLSERLADDYGYIIDKLKSSVDIISGFATNIVEPAGRIFGFVSKFAKKKKSDKFEDDIIEEDL